MTSALPASLAEIRDDLLDIDEADRLPFLVEVGDELPEVPAEYREDPSRTERVEECQSPVYIAVEVDDERRVTLHAIAPAEAPTTRGFASMLAQGVRGATVESVLAIPEDFPLTLGLGSLVSPLRLAGMAGMLRRTQRQVRAQQRI